MENFELMKQINMYISSTTGAYNRWFRENNLNSYFIHTMYAVYMEPNLSQKQISENYQIPAQTVNNAIHIMKNEGYINLVTDENDRRSRKIVITDKGLDYMKSTLAPMLELDSKVLERIGYNQALQLIEFLKIYDNALREIIEEENGKAVD